MIIILLFSIRYFHRGGIRYCDDYLLLTRRKKEKKSKIKSKSKIKRT